MLDDYHAFIYVGLVISPLVGLVILHHLILLFLWSSLNYSISYTPSHCKYFVKGMFSISILDANSSLTLELITFQKFAQVPFAAFQGCLCGLFCIFLFTNEAEQTKQISLSCGDCG